jgi:ubiquinone/menaquinone biosynthesis C-methylase UbiE
MSESKPVFDADAYKRTQHDQWNEDAAAWHRWGPTLQTWFGDVTQKMLDFAHVGLGQRVLDIAAGAGEPALSAAERVGPQGDVLATDLSENILQFAQKIADDRGLSHFKTQAMDGEHLALPDASFDIVLCRFGLIYMPNRQQALTEWLRVLKPGGRAVVAVSRDHSAWVVTVFSKALYAKRATAILKRTHSPRLYSWPPPPSAFGSSASHLALSTR